MIKIREPKVERWYLTACQIVNFARWFCAFSFSSYSSSQTQGPGTITKKGCITKTYQQILESRSSPWLSFATTRGDHGFQQFHLKFVRCILHPCVFLLLFHRECFGNMNWRSLENNFSKMEKQIKSLMHPRTKNYAANGVIIETLQFMGCASGAAMCWCNFSWPKVHWDCIDCITIVNWNQDINDFAFTIEQWIYQLLCCG